MQVRAASEGKLSAKSAGCRRNKHQAIEIHFHFYFITISFKWTLKAHQMAASRGNYFCRFLLLFVLLLLLPAPTNNGKNKPKAPVKQWPRQESSHDKSSMAAAAAPTATEQIETRRAPRLKNKLIAMALGCWLYPSLGLRLVWAGQTKGIFQFSQNVFLRKQNQGEGRARASKTDSQHAVCRALKWSN